MPPSNRVELMRPSSIREMLQLSKSMTDVIHFEQGEPDFITPEHVRKAAIDAVQEGHTHYTEMEGTIELREAISHKLAKENRIT